MARTVRDSRLETRAARDRLRPQPKPFWRTIIPGVLHLGYRKRRAGTPGRWVVRRYTRTVGPGSPYRVSDLALADDFHDANGDTVLSFSEAQARAVERENAKAVMDSKPLTVAGAMDRYFEFLEGDGRSPASIADVRYRDAAFIRRKLGREDVANLTADRLRRWRDDLAQQPPRLRTRKGQPQKHRDVADDDARRARRATANRTWTVFRAALNHAFHDGKVVTDLAWRKVKPFRSVDAARIRYLTVAEAKRLINACDPDFRLLVEGALQTGARYGELCRLEVADFNPNSGTIAVRQSKTGKPRHVVLTDEGHAFFERLTAGRAGNELMFRKCWGASHQLRPMAEAVARAKIRPAISFHGLRHTWASLSVMAGMPLMIVARNLGHVDTRMVEKHYGHLAPSYIADAIRAAAPRFGTGGQGNVASLNRLAKRPAGA
jgi:integrase